MRSATSLLAGILVVVGIGCGGGSSVSCPAGTPEATRVAACVRMFECRASLGLTDDAFLAAYGADAATCKALPSMPFTDVIEAEFGGRAEWDRQFSTYATGFNWCITAVEHASCADIASGALLASGGYCSKEVITGQQPPPGDLTSIINSSC